MAKPAMFTPMSVGGAIGRAALNALKHGVEHRENLNVAVIIDGRPAIGFQMEGVDHIHVGQIGRRGFIGQIDRVLERQVPDREGLVFGVARANAAPVLVIELAQAGGHFAAARSRAR